MDTEKIGTVQDYYCECTNHGECGWEGFYSECTMFDVLNPRCPDCGSTTEPSQIY